MVIGPHRAEAGRGDSACLHRDLDARGRRAAAGGRTAGGQASEARYLSNQASVRSQASAAAASS